MDNSFPRPRGASPIRFDRRLLRRAQTAEGPLALAIALGAGGGAMVVVQAYLLSLVVSQVFLDGRE
ncbi:MAG: hypothetical protein PVH95_10780, partial [Anaerolineae bacterium]